MADGNPVPRFHLSGFRRHAPAPRTVLVWLRTLLIALAGGILANIAGLPAGWLSGSMIAVTAAAFLKVDVAIPIRLVDVVFVMIGVLLGSGVTPEIVDRIGAWPVSLVGLVVSVVLVTVSVQAFLVYVARWDRLTAFFAALPGALSYAVALATMNGADVRRVATGQTIRLFLLVALIPAIVSFIEPLPPGFAAHAVTRPEHLVPLILLSAVGSFIFLKLRMPAALLTGALVVSSVAHGTGWVTGSFPDWLMIATYVSLGAMIGCRFVGTTIAFLRSVIVASLGAFVVAIVVAGLCAAVVAALVDVPVAQILVAFAPGGLDAMTALALALNLDSVFVAAHQLARYVFIAIVAPFATRSLFGRPPAQTSGKKKKD